MNEKPLPEIIRCTRLVSSYQFKDARRVNTGIEEDELGTPKVNSSCNLQENAATIMHSRAKLCE